MPFALKVVRDCRVSNDSLHISVHKSSSFVLFNSNYFLCLHYFAFDALQFIFLVNVLQSVFFIFIKLNGEGASPLPIPTSLKSFYLKKKMIMCAS